MRASPTLAAPLGIDQAPVSRRAQIGPPGWATSTSTPSPTRRNSRRPADSLGIGPLRLTRSTRKRPKEPYRTVTPTPLPSKLGLVAAAPASSASSALRPRRRRFGDPVRSSLIGPASVPPAPSGKPNDIGVGGPSQRPCPRSCRSARATCPRQAVGVDKLCTFRPVAATPARGGGGRRTPQERVHREGLASTKHASQTLAAVPARPALPAPGTRCHRLPALPALRTRLRHGPWRVWAPRNQADSADRRDCRRVARPCRTPVRPARAEWVFGRSRGYPSATTPRAEPAGATSWCRR